MQKKYIKFILLLTITFLVILTFLIKEESEEWSCKDCNIILISMDTLGAKHLNADTSPELDSLTKEHGIVFTEAFSQAPWTLPSHISMFTGKYFPVSSGKYSLPEDEYTIAEALRDNGYQTTAFSTGPYVQRIWGLDQGFESFTEIPSETEQDWNDLPRIFDDSLTWLNNRNSEKPFFLFIHPFHTHDPYGDIGVEDIVEFNKKSEISDPSIFLNAYHKEITEFDSAFKKLYDILAQRDLLENTIIILTSDHGEEFGEHGTVALHAVTTYREVLHVPLVIFHPNKKPLMVNYSVGVSAIPQTIFDILQLGHFSEMTSLLKITDDTVIESSTSLTKEGLLMFYAKRVEKLSDLIKTLDDSGHTKLPEITKEYTVGNFTRSAIYDKWHLIQNMDKNLELFNMLIDPDEKNNLIEKVETFSTQDREDIQKLFETLNI